MNRIANNLIVVNTETRDGDVVHTMRVTRKRYGFRHAAVIVTLTTPPESGRTEWEIWCDCGKGGVEPSPAQARQAAIASAGGCSCGERRYWGLA